MCKMLTSLIHPAEFRELLMDRVHRGEVDNFDRWCDLLAGFQDYYQGIHRRMSRHTGTDTTNTTTHYSSGHNKKASRHDKSGPKQQPTLMDAAAAPAPKDDKHKRVPRSERLPPSPCFHCGEMHWAQFCPTKAPTGEAKESAKATPSVPPPPPPSRGRAKHVKATQDTSDGTIAIADTAIAFVLDTGATNSFIADTTARKLLASDTVTLTPLRTPLRIETATDGDGGTLTATYTISTAAQLVFHDGRRLTIPKLVLYAAAGLNSTEVLIGRGTMKDLGLDIVQALATACPQPQHTDNQLPRTSSPPWKNCD
jgi:hypothetical protein